MLKIGPSMLRNKVGPVFNTRNCVCFLLFLFCFEKSSSCRENDIFQKIGPAFNRKWQILDQFLNLQHACIYLYIYICEGGVAIYIYIYTYVYAGERVF